MLPILFENSSFPVFLYPLLMGVAWAVAFWCTESLLKKTPHSIKNFTLIYLGIFISSWIGAKVFFLFFSAGEMKSQYLSNENFWLGGGFVFYGGLIFAAMALVLMSKVFSFFEFKDAYLFLPALSLSHGIGRIGCLMAGCCYGTKHEGFLSVFLHGAHRYPVQLFESVALISLGVILYKQVLKKANPYRVISYYLVSYSLVRFFLEYIRGDKVRGIHFADLSTSQYVSIALLVAGIISYTVSGAGASSEAS